MDRLREKWSPNLGNMGVRIGTGVASSVAVTLLGLRCFNRASTMWGALFGAGLGAATTGVILNRPKWIRHKCEVSADRDREYGAYAAKANVTFEGIKASLDEYSKPARVASAIVHRIGNGERTVRHVLMTSSKIFGVGLLLYGIHSWSSGKLVRHACGFISGMQAFVPVCATVILATALCTDREPDLDLYPAIGSLTRAGR